MTNRRILLLLFALLPGCYRYVPEPTLDPVPGMEYRAYLSATGSEQMRPLLGQDVVYFGGRAVAVHDTIFEFVMGSTVKRTDPRPMIWSGERIAVPRGTLERIERREMDRRRTVRAAALFTAGTFVVGSIWLGVSGKSSGSGTGPPTNPP